MSAGAVPPDRGSETALTGAFQPMDMVTTLGVVLGVLFTLTAVALHYTRGLEWRPSEDVAIEVLERRAE